MNIPNSNDLLQVKGQRHRYLCTERKILIINILIFERFRLEKVIVIPFVF